MGNESQIDYVVCRRHEELSIKNSKVIPGEACLTQHRLLWAEVVIKGRKKRVWNRGEKKIKAWKLKDPIKRRMFVERVNDRIEGANVDHAGFSNALLNSAREVCGETTGRRQRIEKHGGVMRKCSYSRQGFRAVSKELYHTGI